MPRPFGDRAALPEMTNLPTPPPADPVPLVADWVATVTARGVVRNPNAMALATSNAAGVPSVRMVLLKELAPAGYAVFYTNYGSRKAAELEHRGRGAAMLYWESLGRQARFEGPVVRSPAAESDAYFASRPLRSQLSAWSSQQSRPLANPADLDAAAERAARDLGIAADGTTATRPVPRPEFWGGYRLWFDTVELWAEGANRFHERLRYRRELDRADAFTFRAGAWAVQRLQP
jgi:pyridoxamine 5'-phosphate oxidase